ncbi:hypothetical protein BIW11_00233 [Tropilaelaps mercedesae]|uniref:Uncharacterized protein n=1 Tax=Tropilaelaps mercedesae TaxID=418985 RepID=A0A1V9XZI9_9ACAR|nr:hypothetical protein BIW11_00233 [Tropilaelaps mercedesae]
MYSNRSFEIPRCSAGPPRHPVATPRTSRKFFDSATALDISQSSLDIQDMHSHDLHHMGHLDHMGHTTFGAMHALAPPTPVFSGKIHNEGRHRRLGAALGVACVVLGIALASWALHHFVVESTHTLVSQLYLIANANRNLRAVPVCVLLLSLLAIANGCLSFSRRLIVRFVHVVLSLGLIGALVFVAVGTKRAEPQMNEFFRKNSLRQLQDDYGIVPEVTHSIDYVQVSEPLCKRVATSTDHAQVTTETPEYGQARARIRVALVQIRGGIVVLGQHKFATTTEAVSGNPWMPLQDNCGLKGNRTGDI